MDRIVCEGNYLFLCWLFLVLHNKDLQIPIYTQLVVQNVQKIIIIDLSVILLM